jgi:hypothetical protein
MIRPEISGSAVGDEVLEGILEDFAAQIHRELGDLFPAGVSSPADSSEAPAISSSWRLS